MRDCVLFLQLGAGTGRGKGGPERDVLCQLTSLIWKWFLELQAHTLTGSWAFGRQRCFFSYLFGSMSSRMSPMMLAGVWETNQVPLLW